MTLPGVHLLKPLDNGGYGFQTSSGSLAVGLKGLSDQTKFKWFGWPGAEVPRRDVNILEKKLASTFDAVPIWLPNTLATHHYNGFSSTCLLNKFKWIIFH